MVMDDRSMQTNGRGTVAMAATGWGSQRVSHLAIAVAIAGMALASGALAAPGTPGVPQAPVVIYAENLQNLPGPDPIVRLDTYTGVSGQTYTAHSNWLSNCNGWIASANQSVAATAQVGDCASQINWNRAQQLSWALGLHAGQSEAAARDNYGVSAYTAGNPGAGNVEFQTATNIPFATSNRFVSFSVDVSALNCGASAPLLQFLLVDDADNAIPAGSQINACSSPTTVSVPALGVAGAVTANTGTYASNAAVLVSGASVGVRMVNNNGGGAGNDHAFDNISILDATPQLDKAFSPAEVAVGETSILTFTITNTSELGAKNGWSFTDSLPAGLVVADPAATTNCPNGVVAAPAGGSIIDVAGDLTAGLASCTVTVSVAAPASGSYTNDATNITSAVGISLPGSTALTVLPTADLAIVKTVSVDDVAPGDAVVYTLAVTNNGPESANGARVTDPQPIGLDCSAGPLTCGNEAGGAVCPASPTVSDLQGAGVTIPALPAGGSVEFALTCTVTASGAP